MSVLSIALPNCETNTNRSHLFAGADGTSADASIIVHSQIKATLAVMSKALSSVSSLVLDSNLHSTTYAAAHLPSACPNIKNLHILGRVSRQVLNSFGARCHSLFSLRASNNFLCEGLRHAHMLLPHLTHLEIDNIPFDSMLDLLSCNRWRSVKLQENPIGSHVLNALPDALQHLQGSLELWRHESSADRILLPNLQTMACNINHGGGVDAQSIELLLREAQTLSHISFIERGRVFMPLNLSYLSVECIPQDAPTINYIHQRHHAISPQLIDSGLHFCMSGNNIDREHAFFAMMQPLPYVQGVLFCAEENRCNTQQLVQLFPSVSSYALQSDSPQHYSELKPLSLCPNLKQLALTTMEGRYRWKTLQKLIPKLTSLRILHLHQSDQNITKEEALRLASHDVGWLRLNFPHLDVFVSADRAIVDGMDMVDDWESDLEVM